MAEWDLYYARWLLSDGEEDRRVGEIFDWWLLDFWTPTGLIKSQEKQKWAAVQADFHYRVNAEVVHLSKEACVIDFGLLVVGSSEQIPVGCIPGDYVAGQFRINLPNVAHRVPEELLPKLANKWRVNGILADMARLVSSADNSQALYWREAEIPYRNVLSTTESGPCRGYVLKCTRIE